MNHVLQCNRSGNEPWAVYCFSQELPTRNCGSWLPSTNAPSCGTARCKKLRDKWQALWERRHLNWSELLQKEPECDLFKAERQRRCQVLDKSPAARERLLTQFADAPYVHPYNQPKYQAQICHAVNFARAQRRKVLWRIAQGWPLTAEELDLDSDRLAASIPTITMFLS